MRAMACFPAALVAAALIVGVAAQDVRPTFTSLDASGAQLNVDPSFMWEWTLAERTYSSEAALQSAGLFYGQYASMETYRYAGNLGNATAADHELLLESSTATAAQGMGLDTTRYGGSTTNRTAFAEWLKAELREGRPVMLGMFKLINETVGGYGDYDHVALVIGYTVNATDPVLATVAFLDFFADTVTHIDSRALWKTRDQWRTSNLNPGRPYSYAVPVGGWEALSVVGVRDTNSSYPSQAARVQANVTMFREPSWPTGEAPQNITVDVSVTGLTPNRFYRLLRFDTNLTIPSANFVSAGSIAWTHEFRADASGALAYPDVTFLLSDALVAYRIVVINDPPATPAPPIVVARGATCLTDGPGIYSLDASSTECNPLQRCRENLCSCLGVGDGNRCWLRSLIPCSRYSMCFALATHCIESVARFSGDEANCDDLTRLYNASAPSSTPAYSNNERVYRESDLGKQCYSFACDAFRSYFPTNEQCTLDYDAVCDLPGDQHFRLELRVADTSVAALVAYHVNRETYFATAKADLDAVLATTNAGRNTVTVLSVSSNGGDRLYVDVRIEQSNEYPDTTLFQSTVAAGTAAIPTLTAAVIASTGKPATVVTVAGFGEQTTPAAKTGVAGLIDSCENSCVIAVSVSAIVFIAAVMCVIFCVRYLCFEQPDDAGASSMSAAVRKVMDKQKQREMARRNELEDADEAATTKTHEPTEL